MENIDLNPNQHLPQWARSQEAAHARREELMEKVDSLTSDIKQQALGELVVRGIEIEDYDQQLAGKLAFELGRLADVAVRYRHPHLDTMEGEDETTRLQRFQLDKVEKLDLIERTHGTEASAVMRELWNEFLPDYELNPGDQAQAA